MDTTSETSNVRLALDSLPRSQRSTSNHVANLRTLLEAAVEQKYGQVAIQQARLIQSAGRHELAVKTWSKKRRDGGADWSVETALKVDGFIAARIKDGDACIRELGLEDTLALSVARLYESA